MDVLQKQFSTSYEVPPMKKTPDVAIAFDVELPIAVTMNWEVASYVKGYHVYKRGWTPISNEVLQTRRESENPTDKYAVCLLKDGKVVGHLKKGSNGRFAKTIFYFLRSSTYAKCSNKITGKPLNLADGKGMQVPCMLELEGQGRYIDVSQQNLSIKLLFRTFVCVLFLLSFIFVTFNEFKQI